MMNNCEMCPIGTSACLAIADGIPRLCELARTRPPYRRWMLDRSAGIGRPFGGDVVVRGHGNSTGYGRMAAYLAKAIDALGQPVSFDSIEGAAPSLDPFLSGRLVARPYAGPAVQMSSPWAVELPGQALFSMYEASKLPPASVATYNAGKVVVVPCEWNRKVFLDSGVTAPIRVVPLGIDPEVYRPEAGSEPEGFAVLSVNALRGGGHRKDAPGLVAAFVEALGDREDARLVLKIHAEDEFPDPGHPRVTIDRAHRADEEMARLYRSASVYATMTKAEGFGLPVIEAMACGRPVVGPIHSGIAEFLTPACGYPVDWRTEPAGGPWYDETGSGLWYPVAHDSMVAKLREAYGDRDGRRTKGEAAARRAAEFTWQRSAIGLLDVLREFGMVPAKAEPVVPLSESVRLAVLRRECPEGSKPPGCGCNDQLACAAGRGGRTEGGLNLASRADCYRCLEAQTIKAEVHHAIQ